MNWIDVSILLVVTFSILIGVFRGFIREVLSLVNWGTAIFASFYFHERALLLLTSSIESVTVRSVAAFALVFLVFIIIGSLVTHFIGFIVKKSGLSGTDRMLGLVFGFMRGILVSVIILATLSFTPIMKQPVWEQAVILPVFAPLMKWLNDNISEKMTLAFEEPTLKKQVLKGAKQIQEKAIDIYATP